MRVKKAFLYLLTYYVTLILSACGGSFEGGVPGWSSLPSRQGGVLVPSTDKLDANCLNSSEFDTCLFQKSPTAQTQQTYSSSDLESLGSVRHFGVKLTGLNHSGRLENPHLEIKTRSGIPVEVDQPSHLKPSDLSGPHLGQLMAYYWLNRAVEFYQAQVDGFAAQSRRIKVIVDDEVAGYNPSTNTIHLAVGAGRLPMAFDASVMIHFLGQANVYWATEGRINDFRQDQSHRSCEGDPRGCCTSIQGCSRALSYGSADYLAATMFPDSPELAETWSRNRNGQSLCGISRSLEAVRLLSLSQMYRACESSALEGKAQLMGLIYASIWWEVRREVKKNNPGEVPYIDQLHMEHLKALNGASDFTTALNAIREADQRLFSGRYIQLFQTEFRQRGL